MLYQILEQFFQAKKLEKLQQNYMAGVKGGATLLSFSVCGMMMMTINRGLRHLAHLTVCGV